jgi:hypothetical protein
MVTLQVNHKRSNVTYCQQVSSQQFEHQRLTGSQQALSELLEQILSDCKMGPKEKRKRLKMVSLIQLHLLSPGMFVLTHFPWNLDYTYITVVSLHSLKI